MRGNLVLNTEGDNAIANGIKSAYDPPDEIKAESLLDREMFDIGIQNQEETRTEFNEMSLINRLDIDQKAYNSFVPARTADPDEEWKSNAVRPIVHNKIIGLAAHVTAVLLFPKYFFGKKRFLCYSI